MSTKKVSDRTAKHRLLALADLLDTVPEENFDFGDWGRATKGGEVGTDALENADACGTRACALGWAPALTAAKRLGWKFQIMDTLYGRSGEFTKNGRPSNVSKLSKELFGLTVQQFYYLFTDNADDKDDTASGRARQIRRFVRLRY